MTRCWAAVEHGLLLVEDDLEVRYQHPLVGSVVYPDGPARAARAARAPRRRAPTPSARPPSRALGRRPDPARGGLLEAAAGPGERARRLRSRRRARPAQRPADAAGRRRRRSPARARARSSTLPPPARPPSRALAAADLLVASLPAGPGRAEALVRPASTSATTTRAPADALLARRARGVGRRRAPPGQRARPARLAARLMFRGDLRSGIACAREAAAIADRVGDPGLQTARERPSRPHGGAAGAPRPELMARAVTLAEETGQPRPPRRQPARGLAKQLLWAGDLAAAGRALLDAVLADPPLRERARAAVPASLRPRPARVRRGRLRPRSRELARQGIEAARDAENADAEGWLYFPSTLVETWLGHAAEARAARPPPCSTGRNGAARPGRWIVRGRSPCSGCSRSRRTTRRRRQRELSPRAPGCSARWASRTPARCRSSPMRSRRSPVRATRRARARCLRGSSGRRRPSTARGRGRRRSAAPASTCSPSATPPGRRRRGVRACGRELRRAREPPRRRAGAAPGAGARCSAAASGRSRRRRSRTPATGSPRWAPRSGRGRPAGELERASPGRAGGEIGPPAESRIAALVAEGMRNREIGQDAVHERRHRRGARFFGSTASSTSARAASSQSSPVRRGRGPRQRAPAPAAA